MASESLPITVLIRVRNEARHLARVLEALAAQCPGAGEIIVVDNESSDGSREVAEKANARLIPISRSDFSYGHALNLGIQAARNDVVVILSAHSLPVGADFLRKCLAPFSNPRVGAIRCLHATNRGELAGWSDSRILGAPADLDTVIAKGPVASACAIRRAAWLEVKFDESLVAVEDKFWAFEILERGWLISSSEAMYLYLRSLGLLEHVRKMNRDRLAYYRKTGKQFQHPPIGLGQVLRHVFVDIPHRAVHSVAEQGLLYLYLKTIPLQARRKAHRGSIW